MKSADINIKGNEDMCSLPLAGTGGSVNNGLALLDLAEAGGVAGQQVVISGGVEAADVDVLVALDSVLEALVKRLALLRGGEDSRDGGRDGRFLFVESL